MRAVWYSAVALLVVPVAVHVAAQGVKKLKQPPPEGAAPAKANKVKAPKPPKPPREVAEAQKLFDRAAKSVDKMDRDGDGRLDEGELPAKWRAQAMRSDRDGDGKLSVVELAHYLDTVDREKQEQKAAKKVAAERAAGPAPAPEAGPGRGAVYRPGQLPAGLPGWFGELDADRDGQVGLYEWRDAGGDADEFVRLDVNGDGLLTAEEMLRAQRWAR